jgi:O-antigen/teichoic acid export membrane protein
MLNNFFYLSLGQLVTTIFLLLLAFFFLNQKDWIDLSHSMNQLNVKDFFEHAKKFIKVNYEFLLANLIFVFHIQTPIIYGSYILNAEKIAILGVSYTLFLGLFFFPNLFIQRYLFPVMANSKKLDLSKKISYFSESLIILFTGVCILIVGYYLSEFIINTIFPIDYQQSINLFKIIIFALPLKLLVSYLVNICVLNDLTPKLNRALIYGLIINLFIFFIFYKLLTIEVIFYSLVIFETIFIILILSILLKNKSKLS